MQLENFEKLEEKITRAIEVIDRLKQENQEISSSYRKLAEEIHNFETVTKRSNAEAELHKHELADKERNFARKREEIKKRVEKLIEKLAPLGDLDYTILENKDN